MFYSNVVVFGGSGFLGRIIVHKLAQQGLRIRVVCRHLQEAQFLTSMGEVGQITLTAASIDDSQHIQHILKGADIAVNAVGIIAERGKQTFNKIHVDGARNIAQSAAKSDIKRFIHISALGADANSPSHYACSKAQGEQEVHNAFPQATILRPSLIFGENDHFITLFAKMAMMSPVLPLIGGGLTRFQPIYVGDVASAVVQAMDHDKAQGNIYELGGPDIMTFKNILEAIVETMQRQRYFLNVPFSLARMMGKIMQVFPQPLLTADQVTLLKSDSVPLCDALTCKDLGIQPLALLPQLSSYLRHFQRHF